MFSGSFFFGGVPQGKDEGDKGNEVKLNNFFVFVSSTFNFTVGI